MHRTLKGEDRQELLDQLTAEHRALDARLRELDRHLWLSPEEQAEVVEIKKRKLWAKDRLQRLRAN